MNWLATPCSATEYQWGLEEKEWKKRGKWACFLLACNGWNEDVRARRTLLRCINLYAESVIYAQNLLQLDMAGFWSLSKDFGKHSKLEFDFYWCLLRENNRKNCQTPEHETLLWLFFAPFFSRSFSAKSPIFLFDKRMKFIVTLKIQKSNRIWCSFRKG